MASVYEIITEKIIDALAQGKVPWQKPWKTAGGDIARNAITSRPYSGINTLLLGMADFSDPRWLTYKQAAANGGQVRKGEKGTMVVFWSMIEDKKAQKGPDGKSKLIPLLRYYTVFNVEQVDGLTVEPLYPADVTWTALEAAELAVKDMQNAPIIRHKLGDRAYYKRSEDTITLPSRAQFADGNEYYSTVFHELGHATGHDSRLARHAAEGTWGPFGSAPYSKEELVAEFTSAFVCATLGINNTQRNSASYIQGWLEVLKGDVRLAVSAAGQAQKAADYILNRNIAAEKEEEGE